MSIRRVLTALCVALPIALSACAWSSPPRAETDGGGTADVAAARIGVQEALTLLGGIGIVRPAELIGIYAAMYLGDGLTVPVRAAVLGVEAQIKIQSRKSSPQQLESLYGLLQEFAAVLHVDVVDLLNRSDDRVRTLDTYVIGLGNITERSRRRTEDLDEQIAALEAEQKTLKAEATKTGREHKNAITLNDYATAEELQATLNEQKGQLSTNDLQLDELYVLQDVFTELLEIAHARLLAIDGNREIIIAGLRVVDIPGVEDLGVIEGKARSKRGSRGRGFNPFGGL